MAQESDMRSTMTVSLSVDTEGIMITSDFNLIDIDFYMEYCIGSGASEFRQPEYILKNVAPRRSVRQS